MGMWNKLASSMLIGALLLTGCGGGQKPLDTPTKQANSRPPLQVPAQFASNEEKLQFAIGAVRDGYYEEGKALLEQTIALDANAEAYRFLGTARYNVKNYSGAIEAWSKAAEMNTSLAGEMKNNIGNALRDSGQQEDAKAAYKEALTLEPTRWNAAVNWAIVLQQENRTDEAIAVLEQAIPDNADVEPLLTLRDSLKNPEQNRS